MPALVATWRVTRASRSTARNQGVRNAAAGLDEREIGEAGAALLSLQRGLTGRRALAGAGYMDDPGLLGAYLLYYWPVSYMQVSLALAELAGGQAAAPSASPRVRALDLGSGPGPASAAIIDALCDVDVEMTLADASSPALDLAQKVLGLGDRKPSGLSRLTIDLESGAELPPGPFDLIVMGHCLNELWRGAADALDRREALLLRAADRLAPGGRILLVEPSLLATSRELIALRDRLARRSWRVVAPCPGSYACPVYAAGPDRTCHAQSAWQPPALVRALAAEAGLDRDSVKFAYFIFEPRAAPSSTLCDTESPMADAPGERPLRVISDPMLNKAGRLRYHLCGPEGIATISAKADDAEARAAGFLSLGRGDLVRPIAFEAREGGGLGFVAGSRLELAGRAPEAS